MGRSSKKGFYVYQKLLKKMSKLEPGDGNVIKTWARSCTITPEMVGYIFGVHNGRVHIEVKVDEARVGHKLGEFSPTRKFVSHGGKMAKGQKGQKGE